MEKLSNESKQEAGRRLLENLEESSLEHRLVASLADSLADTGHAAACFLAFQALHEKVGEIIKECQKDEGGEWFAHSYYWPISEFYRLLRENYSQICYLQLDVNNSFEAGRHEIDFRPEDRFEALIGDIGNKERSSLPNGPTFIIDYHQIRNLLLAPAEQLRKERLISEYRTTAKTIKALVNSNRGYSETKLPLYYCYRQPLEQLAATCSDIAPSMEYAHMHLVS